MPSREHRGVRPRGQTRGSDAGVRPRGQISGSRSGGQIRGSDPGVRSCSQIAGQDAEVAGGNPRPRAVTVTIHGLTLIDVDRDLLILDIHCSAGFYVRALADDLGERLGTGAHLTALRRTQSGEFTLEDAMPLDVAENNPTAAARRVIPLAGLLTTLNAVKLTHEGVRFAAHGREIGPAACEGIVPLSSAYVRLLDPSGDLIGVGVPSATPGLLHPSVVLM